MSRNAELVNGKSQRTSAPVIGTRVASAPGPGCWPIELPCVLEHLQIGTAAFSLVRRLSDADSAIGHVRTRPRPALARGGRARVRRLPADHPVGSWSGQFRRRDTSARAVRLDRADSGVAASPVGPITPLAPVVPRAAVQPVLRGTALRGGARSHRAAAASTRTRHCAGARRRLPRPAGGRGRAGEDDSGRPGNRGAADTRRGRPRADRHAGRPARTVGRRTLGSL